MNTTIQVLSAKVVRYKTRDHSEAWEVEFITDQGKRMSSATWNSKGAAQAYADAVIARKRRAEFFYL